MAKDLTKLRGENLTDRIWQVGWLYIRHVVDTAREPFIVLDVNLKVLAANEAFYRTFDVTAQETENHLVYEIGNGQWAGKHLRTLLDSIIPKETFFRDYEVDHEFPGIGRRIMMLNARRVIVEDELPKLIILAMEDVTKQRMFETRLTEHAKELENKVIERTKELLERIEQLERISAITTGAS